MIQLQAGYVFDSVKENLLNHYQKETVEGLLRHLSFFDLEIDTSTPDYNNSGLQQTLSVANNIISRGLPTRSSLWVENTILQSDQGTQEDKSTLLSGSLNRHLREDKKKIGTLFRALHIIEPSLKSDIIQKNEIHTWENLDIPFEQDFLYNRIPAYLSEYWIQLFDSQRELKHLLQFATKAEDEIDKYLNGTIQIANEQKLDFVIEYPYLINGKRGIVIEIDGPHHDHPIQIYKDNNRDTATENAKFGRSIRINTRKWDSINEHIYRIGLLERHSYFKILKQNFEYPLYMNKDGMNALEIVLIPFAIARIQKTIIHLLLKGKLDIYAREWNIAVLERDIPCARIAFDDLKQLLDTLLGLQGIVVKLPMVNLYIKSDSRFEKCKFAVENTLTEKIKYDLFIDISVFQRSGLTNIEPEIQADTKVLIRSSHAPNTLLKFETAGSIFYKPLGHYDRSVFVEDKQQVKLLKKLLQDIFRKNTFRAGQIEILNRSLQNENIIGLLPSASGKSLAYQLTAILQPGLTLVIEPTNELINYQCNNLIRNAIDCTVSVHNAMKRKERITALEKVKNAQTIFTFIIPEMLQEETFRKELLTLSLLNHNYFCNFIIDEAHCISEWGHDFRTSYVGLGNAARKYCLTKLKNNISIMALTATASYNAITDIQNELLIDNEKGIVRTPYPDRREMHFKVVEVNANMDFNAGISLNNKLILQETKLSYLFLQLEQISTYFEALHKNGKIALNPVNFDNCSNPYKLYEGIIYCPRNNPCWDVESLTKIVKNYFIDFNLSPLYGNTDAEPKELKSANEKAIFISNQTTVLVVPGNMDIGINDKNIRFVVHFDYPDSIEHYYQEINRAGRDGKTAVSILLFNKQYFTINEKHEISENNVSNETTHSKNISIDKKRLLDSLQQHFSGIEKEKNILAELLYEINYPAGKIKNYIEERIFKEFAADIQINIVSENNREIMYILPDYGSICIDRDNLPFHTAITPQAIKIADYVKQIINVEKPDGITTLKWLNQRVHVNMTAPGIGTLLADKKNNSKYQVVIPFTNNKILEITQFLNGNGLSFTYRMINDAQNQCNDFENFIVNLERIYKSVNKDEIHITDILKQTLRKLFSGIRNENDTLKAIYRLSVIGAIDDYAIDYNTKIIYVTISRKEQGYYTNNLKKYILRCSSPEYTEEKFKWLPSYKGSNEIQKCLNLLLNYIYMEITTAHKEAIGTMEQACTIGLQNNGGRKMQDFINYYMDSKYAYDTYLPADTNIGTIADFDIVEKYMDMVTCEHNQINNIKHLRRSSDRLMSNFPDNFVFIILSAFSAFLIGNENQYIMVEAQNHFVNGFLKIHEKTGQNAVMLKIKMETFKEKIGKFDRKLIEKVEESENIVLHTIYTNWLKKFNANFINK